MDLGLKELGITFLVGAFTILGLEMILYHFFKIQLTGFFHGQLGLSHSTQEKPKKHEVVPRRALQRRLNHGMIRHRETPAAKNSEESDKESPMRTAVFIGLAFAIGVLAEDVSEKYRDGLHTPFNSVSARVFPNSLIEVIDLPIKYDARMKTLFKDLEADKPVPRLMAEELARTKSFTLADPVYGEKVDRWINTPNRCIPSTSSSDSCPSLAELELSATKLYYYAKNMTFAEANYYDELKKIQIRMDFSRSISMLAFVYFVAALLVVVILLIRMACLTIISPARSSVLTLLLKTPEDGKRLLTKAPLVLMALFLVHFVAIWAYARESDEFHKRAFGYFSSMQITASQPRKEPPPATKP